MKNCIPAAVAIAIFAAWTSLGSESSDEPQTLAKGTKPMLKAVVHINFADAERQGHALKNIANILKEVNNAAEIVVVCHGGGIGLAVKEPNPHAAKVESLIVEGVRFAACENTMRDKSISKESLATGVTTVPSGAVEVIRKQQDGYSYFKP